MKYLKSLNWSGYLIVLVISALASFANKNTINDQNVVNWTNWLVGFLIGAVLGLFILIAGRSE